MRRSEAAGVRGARHVDQVGEARVERPLVQTRALVVRRVASAKYAVPGLAGAQGRRLDPVREKGASIGGIARRKIGQGASEALEVHRFDLPNLRALNFVILGLLGEGVASSTRPDPQANGLGEFLRSRLVELPESLLVDRPRARAGRGSP